MKGVPAIFPEAYSNDHLPGSDTSASLDNATAIEPGLVEQLEYILGNMSIGVAILDATSLHIHYTNAYMHSLLDEPWCNQDVRAHSVQEVLAPKVYNLIYPLLQQVATTGQRLQHAEIPYEGFLETRGRTYWKVSIEIASTYTPPLSPPATLSVENSLLITIEDVTESVRSHLHLNAIDYITSAIAGPSSLYLVLDRILLILQEMFGSKRCSVLLIDQVPTNIETRMSVAEDTQHTQTSAPYTATLAAQEGIHATSQNWHPYIDEHTLLGRAVQERNTLILTDTSSIPDLELPFIDYKGEARRPGSVLCVPIFEPLPADHRTLTGPLTASEHPGPDMSIMTIRHTTTVLGSIEVYHRRTRGFPAEEVKLLERFAQQAGLAIQNARLLQSSNRWARAASRQARQKENVMQAIPDGVVIYDPRWRVADANQAARQLLGWSEDIIGLPFTQAMQQSSATFYTDLSQLLQPIAELEQRALSGQIDEFKMIGANGQPYTMRCSYTPIRDELGDLFAFIVIYHDVTEEAAARERIEAEVVSRTAELKQRNEALQQAKAAQELTSARMALLLRRLPSGVILVSAKDTTITVINRHAIQLLQSIGAFGEAGEKLEEASKQAIGAHYEKLLRTSRLYSTSGALVPYEEQPLHSALVHGKASEAELHTTKRDGQIIHLLLNAAPLQASDGTVTSAILVLQEITRIKTLERSREDFFTTMAHELKTPLANIRAHLSALLAQDLQWSGEEQYDFLQTADEQVDRLVGMINHFLDASRVEAGALRLELEPLLIPEMFEDLQDRLEALITSSERHLQIILPEQLPAVLGDYELIISVLSNLLSNAFRYAPEGDVVQLHVETLLTPQPAVQFNVTDRGPGISPEQQLVLFTRFSTFAAMSRPSVDRPGQPTSERRRKTTRWSPATGLGLYISRGIIEAHGSRLTLTSSPGQGATFTFTLPIYKGE